MNKNLSIWAVSDDIHRKMRLLCVGKGVSMAQLLSTLVEKAWSEDKSVPDMLHKRRMKRLINRWGA